VRGRLQHCTCAAPSVYCPHTRSTAEGEADGGSTFATASPPGFAAAAVAQLPVSGPSARATTRRVFRESMRCALSTASRVLSSPPSSTISSGSSIAWFESKGDAVPPSKRSVGNTFNVHQGQDSAFCNGCGGTW
jgi:hypothetical protein